MSMTDKIIGAIDRAITGTKPTPQKSPVENARSSFANWPRRVSNPRWAADCDAKKLYAESSGFKNF